LVGFFSAGWNNVPAENNAPSSAGLPIPADSAKFSGAYTLHSPIHIKGNTNFSVANGVSDGAGTSGDPYIIEGWDISATGTYGIKMENTTSYVIIRNCKIHDSFYMKGCVELFKTDHVRLEKNSIQNGYYGAFLWYSMRTTFTLSDISNNICGINFSYSFTNTITHNNITYNGQNGVDLFTASTNVFVGNSISYNFHGLSIINSTAASITYNNFTYNSHYGVIIFSSSKKNTIILNNFISNNGGGTQAYDDTPSGFNQNRWNTQGTPPPPNHGNHWSDWTSPDTSPKDGIVDMPYFLDSSGGMNRLDVCPLVDPVAVPELPPLFAILVCVFPLLALFIAIRRRTAQAG